MRRTFHIETRTGVVVLSDASAKPAPPDVTEPLFTDYFRERAEDGSLFYLDCEEASSLTLRIAIDETYDDLPRHRFTRLSGSFLLRVPSGQLVVSDHGRPPTEIVLTAAPDNYAVSVLGVPPGALDTEAFEREERMLIGEEDYLYRRRVERVGVVGCIPWVVAFFVVLLYQWSAVSVVAGAVVLASSAPYYLLTKTKRYRDIARRLREHEESFPTFVLELKGAGEAGGLVGGHYVA